jgi:hypothetical protein
VPALGSFYGQATASAGVGSRNLIPTTAPAAEDKAVLPADRTAARLVDYNGPPEDLVW